VLLYWGRHTPKGLLQFYGPHHEATILKIQASN
jgi:hypothetical protein